MSFARHYNLISAHATISAILSAPCLACASQPSVVIVESVPAFYRAENVADNTLSRREEIESRIPRPRIERLCSEVVSGVPGKCLLEDRGEWGLSFIYQDGLRPLLDTKSMEGAGEFVGKTWYQYVGWVEVDRFEGGQELLDKWLELAKSKHSLGCDDGVCRIVTLVKSPVTIGYESIAVCPSVRVGNIWIPKGKCNLVTVSRKWLQVSFGFGSPASASTYSMFFTSAVAGNMEVRVSVCKPNLNLAQITSLIASALKKSPMHLAVDSTEKRLRAVAKQRISPITESSIREVIHLNMTPSFAFDSKCSTTCHLDFSIMLLTTPYNTGKPDDLRPAAIAYKKQFQLAFAKSIRRALLAFCPEGQWNGSNAFFCEQKNSSLPFIWEEERPY